MFNPRTATLAATFVLMVGASGCKKSADELQLQTAALAAEPLTAESTEKAIAEAKANAEEQLKKAEAAAKQAEAEARNDLEGAAGGAGSEKAGNNPSDALAGDPSGSNQKKGLVPAPPKTVSPAPPPKTAPVEEKKGLLPSPPKTEQPKPETEEPKAEPPPETAPAPRKRTFQERKGVSTKRLPQSQ